MNPPALTVQTDQKNSNGQLSIFPGFSEAKILVRDPIDYFGSAQISDFYFNWIEYSFQPFAGIQVSSQLWVPDPNIICGIYKLRNQSDHKRKIKLLLGCISSSPTTGKRMGSVTYHGLEILSGQMGSWHPIIFLSGNTQFTAGPYPTLSSEVELRPGSQEEIRWVAVLGSSSEDSIRNLERIKKTNWDGEISRVRITAQDQIRIKTGNQEWDFAIRMSQKEGAAYFARYIKYLGEVQDNYQVFSAFSALYLLQVLSPIDPDMAVKILDNVISAGNRKSEPSEHQQDQPTDYNTLPLLGELIWLISQDNEQIIDLKVVLDSLENLLVGWFSKDNDHDQDGIPELIHPSQLNLTDGRPEESLSISEFYDNMPFQESPGLGAMLYNELGRLIELKAKTRTKKQNANLAGKQDLLVDFISSSWNREISCFYNRDRDTHHTLQGENLIQASRENFLVLKQDLPTPSRLGISIQGKNMSEIQSRLQLTLHGSNQEGNFRIENITKPDIYWLSDTGWVISRTIFTSIDYITVKGTGKDNKLTVTLPGNNRENISLLLPLWAKLLNVQDAETLINETITNSEKFWSAYGIRSYPDPENAAIQLPWNLLVGQGLLSYGYKSLAGKLFEGWLNSILMNLDRSGLFFSATNANTGEGIGEANSLEGLIPIGFLLQIMGIKIIPNQKIIIEGEYPFSWDVTVSYRGIIIQRDQQRTRVNIPGEETLLFQGANKVIIPLP